MNPNENATCMLWEVIVECNGYAKTFMLVGSVTEKPYVALTEAVLRCSKTQESNILRTLLPSTFERLDKQGILKRNSSSAGIGFSWDGGGDEWEIWFHRFTTPIIYI